jgi:hypothetical protein
VAQLLVLTPTPSQEVLPALGLLSHRVRQVASSTTALLNAPASDLIFLDARRDLVGAKALCKILASTGNPAEADARIRLAVDRRSNDPAQSKIQASGVTIDEASYSAKVHGRSLDLTFKEFELLRFLATHPSRVFTREQLLSEVWGYDYFGGTRTVDVHVRRLRAKLGDSESLIGTVRNVGYRFNVVDDEEA